MNSPMFRSSKWIKSILATGFSVALLSLLSTSASAVTRTTDPTGGGLSHENHQPGLGVNFIIQTAGVFPSRNSGGTAEIDPLGNDSFLGEITMFGGTFAPRGWAFTNGQLLAIDQNQSLYSLLGTTYGGDGRTTFALPDLRGRSPMRFGNGPGLSSYNIGSRDGVDDVTLTEAQMPSHKHPLNPPVEGVITETMNTGGSQSHTNRKPTQAINFYVSPQGIFPSRNSGGEITSNGTDAYIGEIHMAGFNFTPRSNVPADGSLLPIASNTALFSLYGTNYGGDGRTNFGVPDLRGRVATHAGRGPGLSDYRLGSTGGTETVTLNNGEMPSHSHTGTDPTTNTGGSQPHTNVQPYSTVNYIVSLFGTFPSRNSDGGEITPNSGDPFVGEIQMFGGNFAPRGWALADGQLLAISQNDALFSIFGTTFGGDGRTTFGLPDLRGRAPVHVGGFSNVSGPGLRAWSLGERDGRESVTLNVSQLPSHTHQYVPEPDSAALVLLGGLLALTVRRRKVR